MRKISSERFTKVPKLQKLIMKNILCFYIFQKIDLYISVENNFSQKDYQFSLFLSISVLKIYWPYD